VCDCIEVWFRPGAQESRLPSLADPARCATSPVASLRCSMRCGLTWPSAPPSSSPQNTDSLPCCTPSGNCEAGRLPSVPVPAVHARQFGVPAHHHMAACSVLVCTGACGLQVHDTLVSLLSSTDPGVLPLVLVALIGEPVLRCSQLGGYPASHLPCTPILRRWGMRASAHP
jgi:hypothetical protein